jgi:hemerythrin
MQATEFAENFRQEHRMLRDILLALRDALEVSEHEAVQESLEELAEAAGPHFIYEGEALYPALTEIYGDEYVSRLQAEHEETLAAARALAELSDSAELSSQEAKRAMELVNGLLAHVSERDGFAVIVEVLPPERIGAIVKAREQARKTGVTIHEAARRSAKRGAVKRATKLVAAKTKSRKGPAAKPRAAAHTRVKSASKKRVR